ncbi:helix-turn-helix domain-containing protein [Cupriavidus sp. P-10]|uniref:helix-turn-helix domain-containing protein n=1 Tax=Cupriavidus sp. P-10 TaxID=2027911 RepID=UPI001314B887|nr:helix-turn-helix transcriptional regulator [Cupriavidus sp. P-10]BDB27298.1 helix-turn-helix domain-containing protein [Cupriavidus sp. P-10]
MSIQRPTKAAAPIQLLAGRVSVRLDELRIGGERVGQQPLRPWLGFPVEFHKGRAENRDVGALLYPNALIWQQRVGRTRAQMTSGCQEFEAVTHGGDSLLIQENFEFDRGHLQTSDTYGIAVEISREKLTHLFPDESGTMNLSGFKIVQDRTLDNLFSLMEKEIADGCPCGGLYAESLSVALVSYLTHVYACPKTPRKIGNRLSGRNIETIKAHVRENLGNSDELRLAKLASLVHTSPYHFARLFKAALGITPHRYVMDLRIKEAQRLLRAGLTIAEIAVRTGFASSTHMSDVFRRRMGVSPSQYRD